MNKRIIIFLAMGILLFSCKTKKVVENETVETEKEVVVNSSKKVTLDEIQGDYFITSLGGLQELNEFTPTIKIEENGRITGFNGCNSFFGQLNVDEGEFVGNLGSTRRACEGDGGEIERMMMELLRSVTYISAEDVSVKFFSNDKLVMTGETLTLENGSWQVISIENKEYGVMPDFRVENNRLTGNTGCNSFFGMVQQNGFKLKIAEPGMTEMACPDFDSSMEAKFMQALNKVSEFEFEGNVATFSHQGKELFRAENPEKE